jgi:hypothetical protein
VVDLGAYQSRAEARAAVTAAVDEVLAAEAGRLAEGRPESFTAPGDGAVTDCARLLLGDDDELDTLVFVGRVGLPGGSHDVLLFRLDGTGAANGTHRLYEVTSPGCVVVDEVTLG